MTKTMGSDLIDLAIFIRHETKPGKPGEGAILVSDDGDPQKAVWLPKSAFEIERKINATTVTMPERLAIEEGLV